MANNASTPTRHLGKSWDQGFFRNLQYDLPAGMVVFLVAIPLCLGIALASNVSLLAGLIAGVIGGILVGLLSGSQVSVSGPAAGLTVLVISGIEQCGSYPNFLSAVVFAGVLQIIFSFLRLGFLGNFIPSSVIKGMLSGIGILIILKQIPHGLGRDNELELDLSLFQSIPETGVIREVIQAVYAARLPVVIITLICLLILVLWDRPSIQKYKWSTWVPGPLLAVVAGIGINLVYRWILPEFEIKIGQQHLVELPSISSFQALSDQMVFPSFEFTPTVFKVACIIAAIASVETLLSLEAADKIDPWKRISSKNRELLAQGIGNFASGLLGGLPVTAVIVRSSANVYAGARTRASALIHGVLILLSVLLIPHVLNLIPLATLAAILLAVGYKLCRVDIFRKMYQAGPEQFLPFMITTFAVVTIDLFTGVMVGLLTGFSVVILSNFRSSLTRVHTGTNYLIKFNKDISFLSKTKLKRLLSEIPPDSSLMIDGTRAMFIDRDIYETIQDFKETAALNGIKVEMRNTENKEVNLFKSKRRSFIHE